MSPTNNFLGLDKIRGFSVESARLLIPEEEDGTNLAGTAILPNHSVVTFALVRSMLIFMMRPLTLVTGQRYSESQE